MDPLGTLVFRQQVVPLNTARDIETFGGAPVAGARRFAITATFGPHTQTPHPVRDHFPPSQFFEMTDDERLASPSFEEMDAGIEFGSDDVDFDAAQVAAAPLAFETFVVDDKFVPPASGEPAPRYALTVARLLEQARTGSAAMAPIRVAGLARFRGARAPIAVVRERRWTIVTEAGETGGTPEAPLVRTWSEARAEADALNRRGGRWHVAPLHEMEG